MRKSVMILLGMMLLFIALPAVAQNVGPAPVYSQAPDRAVNPWWVTIAAGFGMAIASGLCALGQGKATASAAEALARNPGARPGIQLALLLGLALIESLALYTLVIIFAKVK
jgi:F-type H+-transporting ATPase subunit c